MGKTLCNAIKNKVVSSCSISRSQKLNFWFTPCTVCEGQGVGDTSGVQADVCSGEVTAAAILTAWIQQLRQSKVCEVKTYSKAIFGSQQKKK